MTLEKSISKIFGLEGDEWLKHANPWSVWTRFITLPFIVLSIWSREWIGMYSVIPIIILSFWIYINPRVFAKPKTTNSWASMCVIGEKIWANRDQIEVSNHHKPIIYILTFIQFVGGIFLFAGLYQLNFWPTLTGILVIYLAKMWFLDRMVWVCEEMKDNNEYKKLLY